MAEKSLLAQIEAFLKRESVAETAFGRGALNDPHFIENLRNGRRVWPETAEKVRKFMREYREAAA